MHPLLDALTATALLALFALAEQLRRNGVSTEGTRLVVHVVGAGVAACFPLYLGLPDVVLLGALFSAVLAWTRSRGRLQSVHAVRRPGAGALLFPVGLTLTALLTWSHPAAYAYGALVLALADPAANLAGRRRRGIAWHVAGGRKSLAGSTAFFAVAFALGALFTVAHGGAGSGSVLLVTLILTTTEASLGYGLDNLPIPVLGGVLGQLALNL